MSFGTKLQKLRKEIHLSQEELADKLSVSRQSVSKWESDKAYPEMDKLVTMCKIFNCTLDDLVNEELTDITKMNKTKNHLNEYIDSLLDFITKSINMFGQMKFLSIIKCLIEMAIVVIILLIISMIVGSILSNIMTNFLAFLPYDIKNIILDIGEGIYFILSFILAIIILIHIFKIRYLNYYEFNYDGNEVDNTTPKTIKKSSEKIEKIIIRDPHDRPFAFLAVLSKLVIYFIKFIIACFLTLFVFSLIAFIISLVLLIFLQFKGVNVFGLIIMFMALIIFNVQVMEIFYNFIVNHQNKVKRIFIILLSCIIIGSIGLSLTFIELRNYKIADSNELVNLKNHITYYHMNSEIYFDYSEIEYQIDDSLTDDEIILNLKYDNHFLNLKPEYYNNVVTINQYNTAYDLSYISKTIIQDLKNKIIREYYFDNEHNISQLINRVKQLYYTYEIKKDDGNIVLRNYGLLKEEGPSLENNE